MFRKVGSEDYDPPAGPSGTGQEDGHPSEYLGTAKVPRDLPPRQVLPAEGLPGWRCCHVAQDRRQEPAPPRVAGQYESNNHLFVQSKLLGYNFKIFQVNYEISNVSNKNIYKFRQLRTYHLYPNNCRL